MAGSPRLLKGTPLPHCRDFLPSSGAAEHVGVGAQLDFLQRRRRVVHPESPQQRLGGAAYQLWQRLLPSFARHDFPGTFRALLFL